MQRRFVRAFPMVICLVAFGAATAAAAAPTVTTHKAKVGTYVSDGKGRTLYLFEKDKGKTSKCYGACAKAWKPLIVKGKPKAGPHVKASLLSTTKRTGGAKQVTYGGHPLYYYVGDSKAGQTAGQGASAFGAEWYVVKPSGKKLEAESKKSGTQSTPAPNSGY